MNPKVQLYTGLSAIYRRDKDDYARSTVIQEGHDWYGDASVGVAWVFRERCTLRLQYLYSKNNSNIDIYDFNRYEVNSSVRCDT